MSCVLPMWLRCVAGLAVARPGALRPDFCSVAMIVAASRTSPERCPASACSAGALRSALSKVSRSAMPRPLAALNTRRMALRSLAASLSQASLQGTSQHFSPQ